MKLTFAAPDGQMKKIEGVLWHFPKAKIKGIVRRSVNRAMVAARTAAAKEASGRYGGVTAKEVRGASRITRTGAAQSEATLKITSPSRSLMHFKPSSQEPTYYPKKLKVTIVKGRRKLFKGAFVAKANGGATSFARKGPASLPIEKRFGPPLAGMAGHGFRQGKAQKRAEEMLEKTLLHEIDFALKKR
jgi:hypothetical protein